MRPSISDIGPGSRRGAPADRSRRLYATIATVLALLLAGPSAAGP